MEIEYLNILLQTPILQGRKNKPVREEDIIELETRISRVFPKSYKEFLTIAGNGSNVLASINHGFYHPMKKDIYYIEEQQEVVKETLKEEGCSVGENFWVIADLDGGEQFHFFLF